MVQTLSLSGRRSGRVILTRSASSQAVSLTIQGFTSINWPVVGSAIKMAKGPLSTKARYLASAWRSWFAVA